MSIQLTEAGMGDTGEYVKGSGYRKIRGIGNLATVRRWFRTVAIDDCLNFNVAVVFSSTYFRLLLEMLSL